MKFQPYEYQRYAINKILNSTEVALFLDMGLGKTVITLTAINELMYNRFEVSKVLVIAPLRVAETTWPTEVQKWDHLKCLRVSKILGSERQRVAGYEKEADIYLVNRENVVWLVQKYGKAWPFDLVVIDELSSFKSTSAKRFKALRKVRPMIKRIVGLTGTPAPNGLIDLWPQIYLLDRGKRLGTTITGYKNRYFEPGSYVQNGGRLITTSWVPKPEAEKNIYESLLDLCVSMKAEDWLEIPDRVDRVVPVELPEKARAKYEKFEREMILELVESESIVTAGSAAVVTNKLLQMANGAVYDEEKAAQEIHSSKLEALEDIVEAANGKPVLVFYAYKHDRMRIHEHLKNYKVVDLKTAEDIKLWNQGNIPVLLAHPASSGHGLNLQAGGNIIVWFGLTWSLELYQQANARLHRQGQQQKVIVHYLVASGTVDEDVMRALGRKEKGQEALLEAVKVRIRKYMKHKGR